jgi:hypothetical protein
LDLAASGNIGVGTGSPASKLDVQGDIRTTGAQGVLRLYSNSANGGSRNWGFATNIHTYGDFGFYQSTSSTGNPFVGPARLFIGNTGYVGIGNMAPTHLFQVGTSGAYCDGGAWVDGSSREYKQDIQGLSAEAAEEAVAELTPVTYEYKASPGEHHVGFIAEDVPDLVATPDRKGMSPMDVVAVLTKVVQQQQKTIAELQAKVEKLEKGK